MRAPVVTGDRPRPVQSVGYARDEYDSHVHSGTAPGPFALRTQNDKKVC